MGPLVIAAVVLGVGVPLIAAASSSSSRGAPPPRTGCGGPTSGKNPFGGDYSGAIGGAVQAGRDAGEQNRAKSEADGRKQFVGYAKTVGSIAGAGSLAGDQAGAWYDFGIKLAHWMYGDEYDKANTSDQWGRLNTDIAQIVSMGYPPAGYVDFAEFGARDIADAIEAELHAMSAVSPHDEAAEIGRAAIYSAGAQSSAPEVKKTLADVFAHFAKPTATTIETFWTSANAPTYLLDAVPIAVGSRPEIDYVAAAAAGLYCVPLAAAKTIAYAALNTYASRRGYTNRNDFLGHAYNPRDSAVTDDRADWLNKYGKADAIVDAWNALKTTYDIEYRKSLAAPHGGAAGGGGALSNPFTSNPLTGIHL